MQATLKCNDTRNGWDGTRRAAGANRSRNTEALSKVKASQSERFRELWPDIREMILPRRGIFAMGFLLMVINRLCALWCCRSPPSR